jgi:hypothetical protein
MFLLFGKVHRHRSIYENFEVIFDAYLCFQLNSWRLASLLFSFFQGDEATG